MMRRTVAAQALLRQTSPLQHWDTDMLYGRNIDPLAMRSQIPNRIGNYEAKQFGTFKRPLNNQWGHRWLHRGGEMWRIIDARGMELDALAEQIVLLIMGRHRPDWMRGKDMGDQVIVINCRHVTMDDAEGTPLPWRMRPYSYTTGYPKSWGIQIRRAEEEFVHEPSRPLWLAVYERLPKQHPVNRVRKRYHLHHRFWLEKLHCFADAEHPFKDKNPIPTNFVTETVGAEQYHDLRTLYNVPRRKKPQGWKR
eukprot:TRINITY_DN20833_c0_g1_i1.p2 TRINITY_DN20833_c0_g1~~TRINITY_DN20833_c0_g1_i1.p2  ORF type:complete len:251 (+),score=51.44 TRINITY_DN20833_c0_g1_i1:31-783(+)